MDDKFPKILKPYIFAKKNLSFSTKYDLKNLNKINKLVEGGKADLQLSFDLIDRLIVATGSIIINTKLICNNCLDFVDFDYTGEINIAFTSNNQQVDEKYEIIDLADEIITDEFIADEVLLAFPMFAKHDYKCITEQKKVIIGQEEKVNPFAILKNIKRK